MTEILTNGADWLVKTNGGSPPKTFLPYASLRDQSQARDAVIVIVAPPLKLPMHAILSKIILSTTVNISLGSY